MQRRISVRAIVMHEGKLLCVRLKAYRETIKNDHWCLTGGGLDDGEALVPGIEREMLEETGIEPNIGALLYVHQFGDATADNLEFFFHVTNAKDYLHIDLSKATHGLAEIEEIAFVDPRTTHILPAFLRTEPLVEKISKPGNVDIFSYPD